MIHVGQLRVYVIQPTLKKLDLYSTAAENLLVLTHLTEGNVPMSAGITTCLKQLGTGPALGIFQMEPPTHDDIWRNWLNFQKPLRSKVLELVGEYGEDEIPPAQLLMGDLFYACLMARLLYRRRPEPLPAADDVAGLANYWKQHYNTRLGDGNPIKAATLYRQYGQ